MGESNEAYPMKDIGKPGPNDVMFGRGGGTNNHVGNIRFRQLVNDHKYRYLAASKVDKPKVAREVVAIWRKLSPPGRFLTKTKGSKDATWYDVGDQKAREKASQCLRERTPDVIPFVHKMQGMPQEAKQKMAEDLAATLTKPSEQKVNMMEGQFDAAAVAVALLNARNTGEDNPMLKQYLKMMAESNTDSDDLSIDENASVAAIARSLFKNVDNDDLDDVSIADLVRSSEDLTDIRSFMDNMSTSSSWLNEYNNDHDMNSLHSLGRIRENAADAHGLVAPDPIPSSDLRVGRLKNVKSNKSDMSMISELTSTDVGEDFTQRKFPSFSSRTQGMKSTKTNSNISMMSELTDMTGDLSNLEL